MKNLCFQNCISLLILLCAVLSLDSCRKSELSAQMEQHVTHHELCDVQFVTEDLGFISGGEMFQDFCMLRTTDGGDTWSEVRPEGILKSKVLYDIDFNNGILYACGQDGKVLQSIDSGNSWLEFQNQTWTEFYAMNYPSKEAGIAVGSRGNVGNIVALNSYGDYHGFQEFSMKLRSVLVLDTLNSLVGGDGIILYSEDGGNYWQASDADGDLFIDFLSDGNEVFAFGYLGTILKSTDRGHSWTRMSRATNTHVKTLHVRHAMKLNDGSQILVGDKGMICRSTDGWESSTSYQVGDGKENILGIGQAPDGDVIICGSNGWILKGLNF